MKCRHVRGFAGLLTLGVADGREVTAAELRLLQCESHQRHDVLLMMPRGLAGKEPVAGGRDKSLARV